MKKKINVQIHKISDLNAPVLTMVAGNNEGLFSLNANNVIGFLLHKKAEYPSLYKNLSSTIQDNELHISEDNLSTYTLSLSWVEVEELASVDDLKNVNL